MIIERLNNSKNDNNNGIYKIKYPSGKIKFRLRLRDGFNNQICKTFHTLQEAKNEKKIFIGKKVMGENILYQNKKYPFDITAMNWFNNLANDLSINYKNAILCLINKHMIPYFRGKDCRHISQQDIQKYINTRLQEMTLHKGNGKRKTSEATINRERSILKSIYDDMDIPVRNPVNRTSRLQERNPEEFAQALTKDEVRRFLSVTPKEDIGVYKTSLYGGLRAGEIFNLTKDNVDLTSEVIRVRVGNKLTQKTKNKKARTIPIHNDLLPDLKEAISISPNHLVFPSKANNGIRTRIDKAMKAVLNKANINKKVRFHDLRHTFTTHFLESGNTEAMAEVIGGWGKKTMVRRYTHFSIDALKEAINKLDYYKD